MAFPGKVVTIIKSEVRYANPDYAGWEKAWDSLTHDEQSEAYCIYIPTEKETYCGVIGC